MDEGRGYSNSIKLPLPNALPQEGVNNGQFKTWQISVEKFLDQELSNEQFLPGGRYANWTSVVASDRGAKGRITTLFTRAPGSPAHHRDDTVSDAEVRKCVNKEDPTIEVVQGAANRTAYDRMTNDEKEAKKAEIEADRIGIRNRQLSKMLQIVCSVMHHTEAIGVWNDSTSVEWIWEYLKRHYNIQSKGVNFLKVAQINYKSGELPQTFYKEFRTAMVDNLRKEGDAKNHLMPGSVMEADEVLSPTFEDAIVLWALDKIDSRLPAWVAKEYEARLDRTTHLIDLQSVIFQRVPSMLESIEREANLAALTTASAALTTSDEASTNCCAFTPYRGRGGRGRSSGRGRGYGNFSGGGVQISPTTGLPRTPKFCMICFKNGKPPNPSVYTTHNTAACNAFSTADRREMLAALQAMDLSDDYAINEEETEGQEANFEGQEPASQGLGEGS